MVFMRLHGWVGLWLLLLWAGFGGLNARGLAAVSWQLTANQAATLQKKPRETLALSYTVHNTSSQTLHFSEHLALPEGWQQLIPFEPFALPPQESSIQFISVLIPATALAGTYSLVYTVTAQNQPQDQQQLALTVEILPVADFNAILLKQPTSVVDGESYTIEIALQNLGNQPLPITYTVKDNLRTYQLMPQSGAIEVAAYGTAVVPFAVTALEKTGAKDLHIINWYFNGAGLERTLSAAITLLYLEKAAFVQRFDTVPSTLTLNGLVDQIGDNPANGYWQTVIQGAGLIQEPGFKKPAFLKYGLRGPTLIAPGFSQAEEYFMQYDGPRYIFRAGDQLYRLSPLLENGQFGRGIEWGIKTAQGQWGSYWLNTPVGAQSQHQMALSSLPQSQQALYGLYQWNPHFQTRFNLLHNEYALSADETETGMGSLYQRWQNEAWRIEGEYAANLMADRPGQAYQLGLGYRHTPLQCGLQGYQSDADFKGEKAGQRQASAYCAWLKSPWFVSAAYQYTDQQALTGLLANPLAADAMPLAQQTQQQSSLNLDYRFRPGLSASLNYTYRLETGLVEGQLKDILDNTLSLGLSVERGAFILNAYIQIEQQQDMDTQMLAERLNGALLLNYAPSPRQLYGMVFNYDQSLLDAREYYTLSVNGQVWLRPQLALNGVFQFAQEQQGDMEIQAQIGLTQTFKNQHRLRLSGYVEPAQQHRSALLSYTVPFNMPAALKKQVGHIRGRLYDQESRRGLADMRIQMGERLTVTDHQGRYQFISLPPATYYPSLLDQDKIGLNYMIADVAAAAIVLNAGQSLVQDIPLVQVAQLSGNVLFYKLKEENQQFTAFNRENNYQAQDLLPDRPFNDALVVLTNLKTQEIVKRLTQASGEFLFDRLRPGTWQVEVFGNIPDGYQLKLPEAPLAIAPGAVQVLHLQLVPVIRALQMEDTAPMEVQ